MDITGFLGKTDILYLNWIEDLPNRHLGTLQVFFLFLLCGYCRLSGKKIVWTLHNRRSHSGDHRFMKNLIFWYMKYRSNLVVTHARVGLSLLPARTRKVFIPHPVSGNQTDLPPGKADNGKQSDVIIWGTIAAYKGVDTFLRYLEREGLLDHYRLLIAGKIVEPDLELYLESLSEKHPNIKLVNRFVPNDELGQMIARSGIILFTYHSGSVLSSGALMDSLLHDSVVLGPHAGAFTDLAEEKLIRTYSDYGDLVAQLDLLKKKDFHEPYRKELKRKFLEENTWPLFHEKLTPHLDGLFRFRKKAASASRQPHS